MLGKEMFSTYTRSSGNIVHDQTIISSRLKGTQFDRCYRSNCLKGWYLHSLIVSIVKKP